MEFCALSSGSSGNCFYLGENKNGILIDCGISAKRLIERLNSIGIKEKEVGKRIKAIFLTHEHSDHKKGADVFARKFNIPIYATKGTLNSFICSNSNLLNEIKTNELVNFRGFDIQTFSKKHKANEPVSFSFVGKKIFPVITDLGFCCDNVHKMISEANSLCIESNHDVKMLEEGPYPWHLKKWIKGDDGHLSNNQTGLGVMEYGNSKLKNVVLAHLSETNNTPELAMKTFKNLIRERKDLKPRIEVSTKEKISKIIRL